MSASSADTVVSRSTAICRNFFSNSGVIRDAITLLSSLWVEELLVCCVKAKLRYWFTTG